MCPAFIHRTQSHFKVAHSVAHNASHTGHKVAVQDFRQLLHPGYPCALLLGFDSYFLLSGICRAKGRSEKPKLKKSSTCRRFCKNKKIPKRKEEGGELRNYGIG